MKFVLLNKKVSQKEIIARKEYIYDVFKIYVYPIYHDSYVELVSIPQNSMNYIFILGHNDEVFNYLKKNNIEEKNIVLITCYIGLIKSLILKNKTIYYANEITDIYDGEQYGFNFNITNVELNLYNSRNKSFVDNINKFFERK